MKKLILLSILFMSCSKEELQPVFNTADGFYSVSLHSESIAGWAGGEDSDTTFEDLCYIATDYGTLYTIDRDSNVTQMPLLGINYTQSFQFATSLNDTAVQIGYETWYLSRISNGDVHLKRYTNYFGMGMDIQTMILTNLK